jgi:hypothetical protein
MTPIQRLEKVRDRLEIQLARARDITSRAKKQQEERNSRVVDLNYEIDILNVAIGKLKGEAE